MKKERRQPRHFDDQFRLRVLKDYYESGVSYCQISRKYDVSSGNVIAWEKKYMNKCVSLPTDIIELKNEGFTLREIEILTGISKSSVSRELKGD